jgi:thiol-disulfide isomerase/thioredoxin
MSGIRKNRLSVEGRMPSLGGATEWLNSEPLGPAELRGHTVLVNFWTLTCINWLGQEPYVRAWSQAYRDDGLVVIGVHTPEFSFEHDVEGVRRATKAREIDRSSWRGTTSRARSSLSPPTPRRARCPSGQRQLLREAEPLRRTGVIRGVGSSGIDDTMLALARGRREDPRRPRPRPGQAKVGRTLRAYYVAYAFFVAEILNLAAPLQTEQPVAIASAALSRCSRSWPCSPCSTTSPPPRPPLANRG